MKLSPAKIFTALFFVILIIEGLGVKSGREIAYYAIVSLPFFLFILSSKSAIATPKNFTILASIFLLLYFSYFLIFVFAFNNKRLLEKFLIPSILLLSALFSLYSMGPIFVPEHGYQFVFSKFLSHNHLADFLLLPLIACFWYLLNKRTKSEARFYNLQSIIYNLLLLFFLPYFVFSYSRSAYLDIVLVIVLIIFNRIREKGKFPSVIPIFVVILVVALSAVLFFATAKDIKKEGIFSGTQEFLSKKYGFEGKEFLASRDQYINESFLSIRQKPLFGVGPGNFRYASVKYTTAPSLWTETAHNIFLEMFVENGALAGIVFILIIFEVFRHSKINLLFFLALAMLLNFQTDYTYRIYSFFALFFVILGANYEEKEVLKWRRSNFVFGLLGALLVLFSLLMVLSNIALKLQKPVIAFYLYPFNKSAYEPLIESSILRKDREEENFLLFLYENFFRGDPSTLSYLGEIYEKRGNSPLALKHYEHAFEANPLGDRNIVWKIYDLKKQFEGEARAKAFADSLFKRVEGVREKWSINETFRIETMKLCQRLYDLACPYEL